MENQKEIQAIIAEIDKRVEDKILEQTNADLLKKLINKADSLTEAISIAELGTTYKRTGFHFDKRIEKFDNTIKYFKKNDELSFKTNPNDITHKLIIGDNYEALLNLLVQYRNSIDVIYIDPPYGKDSMGEFAQTNYNNAITRDNLLSMLYPRLFLAKQLLSDDGVIFCSIDDKNQAYVKCLFDEIFGESNFVGTLIHQRAKGGGQAKYIVKGHDYILVYSNNIDQIKLGRKKVIQQKTYKINGELYIKNNDVVRKVFGKYDKSSGTDRRCFYEELLKYKGEKKKNEIDDKIKSGELFLEENSKGMHIICKYEKISDATSKVYSIIKVLSEDGKNELEQLNIPFDYPKPVEIIKQLIMAGTLIKNDAKILDFFAGSGTTGQAVLELNKEDGGKRQYILVQLNEDLDKSLEQNPKSETIKNQINLCDKYKRPHCLSEITSERLKRVMTGKCFDGCSDFDWIKNHQPLGGNLDVYDIATVANFENTEGKTPFDVIDETLYGKEKFATLKEKIEWVVNNFENTQKTLD